MQNMQTEWMIVYLPLKKMNNRIAIADEVPHDSLVDLILIDYVKKTVWVSLVNS